MREKWQDLSLRSIRLSRLCAEFSRRVIQARNSESETDSSACSASLTVISSTYASPLIPRICQLVIRALARVYHTFTPFISLRGCSFRNARVSHSSLGAITSHQASLAAFLAENARHPRKIRNFLPRFDPRDASRIRQSATSPVHLAADPNSGRERGNSGPD